MRKIVLDPLTRVEGHLRIEVTVDNGEVKDARTAGTLFRGFEIILQGRDPRDASRMTQRVCGVCPIAHATASTLAVDDAYGVADKIPDNGRLIRNLILGANFLQSHILHFYHLAAPDYVDVAAAAGYSGPDAGLRKVAELVAGGELGPFIPRYEGDYRLTKEQNLAAVSHYVRALEMRRKAHEMLTVFGGRMPHEVAIMVGGVTCTPTDDKIAAFLAYLSDLRIFIDDCYLPDVLMVAKAYSDHAELGTGCKRLLTYGVFDQKPKTGPLGEERFFAPGLIDADLKKSAVDPGQITEAVKNSWFDDSCAGSPATSSTKPSPGKDGAYSWLKAPRYGGQPTEVGPLARIAGAYADGKPQVTALVDAVLSELGATPAHLFSVLGRVAARAIEAKVVADAMADWALAIKPGEPTIVDSTAPDEARGVGMSDAARGGVGHWLEVKDKKIANYQLVVPTTWNLGPRDENDVPGPAEQALLGTRVKDLENPFELGRIVRSFDPCLACAVHLVTPRGREIARFKVV